MAKENKDAKHCVLFSTHINTLRDTLLHMSLYMNICRYKEKMYTYTMEKI